MFFQAEEDDLKFTLYREFPLSSEKSMFDVLQEELYPSMVVQMGSAFAAFMVSSLSTCTLVRRRDFLTVINRNQ